MLEKNKMERIKLKKILFGLSNPKRVEIYEICLKEKINITQLQSKINQSYKSVLNHIRILEDADMIRRENNVTKNFQESLICSKPFIKDSLYFNIYNVLKGGKK